MNFFERFRKGTQYLATHLDDAANVLHVWALLKAHIHIYGYLIAMNSPEIARVPELVTRFTAHTIRNLDKHIDIESGRIFNPAVAGEFDDLEDWQEAGYSTNRNDSNYARRRLMFKLIYDETPLIKTKKLKRGGMYIREVDLNKKYNITYRSIVKSRLYRYRRKVPFWLTLNYGTDYFARSGYPVVGGSFFIEKAELLVEKYEQQALDHLEDLVGSVLIGHPMKSVPEGIDATPGWGTVSSSNANSAMLSFAKTYMIGGSTRLYEELADAY